MTLPELLAEADELSLGGYVDGAWLKEKAETVCSTLAGLAVARRTAVAYRAARESVVLDGSERALRLWRSEHEGLVGAHRAVALLNEALRFIRQELEMAVAKGKHEQAKRKGARPTQKEARA